MFNNQSFFWFDLDELARMQNQDQCWIETGPNSMNVASRILRMIVWEGK